MLVTRHRPALHGRAVHHTVRRGLVVALAVTLIAGPTLTAGTRPAPAPDLMMVAEPFDPEVILPARVDAALHRAFDAVERSTAAVDDRRWGAARRALRAATGGFARSSRAVLRQVTAVVDPEAESTAGPDSALASLNVAQVSVSMLVGLLDGVRRPVAVVRIGEAVASAQRRRMRLIEAVTSLDPEGAGAPYADALADTVPMYDDEVASVREALVDDRLTPRASTAVRAALARSTRAQAVMIAAFGGGE